MQQGFRSSYAASSSAALNEVEILTLRSEKELARVEDIRLEFSRLRRTIAAHDTTDTA